MDKRLVYALPATFLAAVAFLLAMAGLFIGDDEAPERPAASSLPAPEAKPAYTYLVAIETISPGEPLASDAFFELNSNEPFPDAIPSKDVPMGDPVQTGLSAGQVLSPRHLQSSSLLETLIEPGFQAIAVPVSDLSGVGGLLRPGDRVDVTVAFRRSDRDQPAAMRLLSNVLVTAVKGVPHQGESLEGNDQRRNETVVLSVPVEMVPKLLLASNEGAIRLAASSRPSRDPELISVGAADEKAVYLEDLFPKPPAPPKKQVRRVVRQPQKQQVEIYEGSESRSVYVN